DAATAAHPRSAYDRGADSQPLHRTRLAAGESVVGASSWRNAAHSRSQSCAARRVDSAWSEARRSPVGLATGRDRAGVAADHFRNADVLVARGRCHIAGAHRIGGTNALGRNRKEITNRPEQDDTKNGEREMKPKRILIVALVAAAIVAEGALYG